MNIFDPASKKSINQKFRERRFSFFLNLLKKVKSDKLLYVLDIGGTQEYWESMNFLNVENVHITLLNLEFTPVKNQNFKSLKGDACDLTDFKDKQFDIVFSNSVIEHLFSKDNQRKMANEVRRVGKNYYIQTPNFYFPIEPHWLFPFFQFLPFNVRVFLTKKYNLGHYRKSVDKQAAEKRVDEVKLLTVKEMKMLFPEGNVYKEKFLGLTKSVTMYYFPSII